jgi:hypothetical protein
VHHLLYDLASRDRAADQCDELAALQLNHGDSQSDRVGASNGLLRDFDPVYVADGSKAIP